MFSDILKELRKSKKITQEDLAKLVGVERSTVGKWESKNIIPSADMLIDLSQLFNVSVDYLLGRTDDKNLTYDKYTEQAKYIESIKLDSAEEAMKFILQQPSVMAFGGYDLNDMSEEEIIDLANDLLFAMKLSLEKHKRK